MCGLVLSVGHAENNGRNFSEQGFCVIVFFISYGKFRFGVVNVVW